VVPWCKLVATIDIYKEVEEKIARLVGTSASNVFASTTLLNHGVIPALSGDNGLILIEQTAHGTMHEGAMIARSNGSKISHFPYNDLCFVETLLKKHKNIKKKLILINGVRSMNGYYSDLPSLTYLAHSYNALLYIDDAHGFGVLGRNPSKQAPYGFEGNGIANYFNLSSENILYVGCFSKAYGTFGAFIACGKELNNFLSFQSSPHDLGGAGPASSMSALLAGLKINEEKGILIRERIYFLTNKARIGLKELGYKINDGTNFPIINVQIGDSKNFNKISEILYNNHILLTLYPYPMVKKGEDSLRITVTALNTENDIEQLILAFTHLKGFLMEENHKFF